MAGGGQDVRPLSIAQQKKDEEQREACQGMLPQAFLTRCGTSGENLSPKATSVADRFSPQTLEESENPQ